MYEIFDKLCKKKNVRPSDVSRATGVSTATLTNWKKGVYKPKQEKLQKIADYFDVSLEYLTTGKENNTRLSNKEHDLIAIYREFSDEERSELERHIDMLCRLKKYKELIDEKSSK